MSTTDRPLFLRIVGIVVATTIGLLMWVACCAGALPIYNLVGGAS